MRIIDCCSRRLRKLALVEQEISDQPFNPPVFALKLPEACAVRSRRWVHPFFLDEERGFVDFHLPADTAGRTVCFYLPEGRHDLLLGAFRPLHGSPPFVENCRTQYRTLVCSCRRFKGRRQYHFVREDKHQYGMKSLYRTMAIEETDSYYLSLFRRAAAWH
jgi:hypothetical protein